MNHAFRLRPHSEAISGSPVRKLLRPCRGVQGKERELRYPFAAIFVQPESADIFQGLVFCLWQRSATRNNVQAKQMTRKIKNVPPGLSKSVLNQSSTTGKTFDAA